MNTISPAPKAPLPNLQDLPVVESSESPFLGGKRPATPLVVRGLVGHWPAIKRWTPDYFKENYGELRFSVSVNLPNDGVPARHRWADHQADKTIAEFVDLVRDPAQRCYIHQLYAHRIPGLESDYAFSDLVGPGAGDPSVFVWIGSGEMSSSFHFDLMANLYVQVFGRKRVFLVSPEDSRCVYPYHYNIAKSRIDPQTVDLAAFPLFAKATIWQAVLEPGDVLYFPCAWWHDFRSLDPSISLNFFYGPQAGWGELARAATAGGAGHWATIAKDFVWHGMLGRDFEQRLFSEKPTGAFIYDLVKDGIKRRLSPGAT